MSIETKDNNVQMGSRNNFGGPVNVHNTTNVTNTKIAISLSLTISLTVGTLLIAKHYYATPKPAPAPDVLPAPPPHIVDPSPSPSVVTPPLVTHHTARPKVVHDLRPRAGEQTIIELIKIGKKFQIEMLRDNGQTKKGRIYCGKYDSDTERFYVFGYGDKEQMDGKPAGYPDDGRLSKGQINFWTQTMTLSKDIDPKFAVLSVDGVVPMARLSINTQCQPKM